MLEITFKSPYKFAHILFQPTIVPHGGHYHFIPESDLSAGELAATYVFNPNDIVRDTGDAYIVRHGVTITIFLSHLLTIPHHTLTRKR
ncbi:TPA: pneumococcal-type histidine triad protein [Streptococcus pneumoniae]|nr:pneumococcal-type histidine triad protein [Streptococcus pneumoniae]HEV0348707.1 pneumococcal-type histidine triad protein [Streptococcus pneumoniae]